MMMKTSPEHLPAAKQAQLAALVELISVHVPAEMIVLFGSHARGDWVEDHETGYISDYDLLVIVENEDLVDNHNLWSTIENKAEGITGKTTLGLIVHSIKDVNHQLEQGWYFFTDLVKEGILLHDSGRFQLAKAKRKSREQRRLYAQACYDRYFEKATDFYESFEFLLNKGRCNTAAFMLHQATETYYKAVLMVVTAYRPKQHNIESLGHQCANLHAAFRDIFPCSDPNDKRRFKLLKLAYVEARYSMTYSISRADLEALSQRVLLLRDRTETICREYIASMGPKVEYKNAPNTQ